MSGYYNFRNALEPTEVTIPLIGMRINKMAKLQTKCNDCKEESKVLIETRMRVFSQKPNGARTEHKTHWLCEVCNLKVIKVIKRDFLD